MFPDYHLHTSFSSDSDTPVNDVIKKATDVAILKVTESDFFMMSPDNFLPLDFFCRKITYLLILS